MIQFGFVAYVAFIASYGDKEVAAYFIGVRILALSFLPGFGFSSAAATLVGQGLGARDPKFARKAGWESTGMAMVLMSAMGLLIYRFRAADRGALHRRSSRSSSTRSHSCTRSPRRSR